MFMSKCFPYQFCSTKKYFLAVFFWGFSLKAGGRPKKEVQQIDGVIVSFIPLFQCTVAILQSIQHVPKSVFVLCYTCVNELIRISA